MSYEPNEGWWHQLNHSLDFPYDQDGNLIDPWESDENMHRYMAWLQRVLILIVAVGLLGMLIYFVAWLSEGHR